MYGLSDALLEQIKALAQRFGIARLVLFGSRARGDFRANSDIDLAAYGLHPRDEMPFLSALEDLPTLLKCDMIAIRKDTDPTLPPASPKSELAYVQRGTSRADFRADHADLSSAV